MRSTYSNLSSSMNDKIKPIDIKVTSAKISSGITLIYKMFLLTLATFLYSLKKILLELEKNYIYLILR